MQRLKRTIVTLIKNSDSNKITLRVKLITKIYFKSTRKRTIYGFLLFILVLCNFE